MKKFKEIFEDKSILLDGEHFEACTFTRCKLIFEGGMPPVLVQNNFNECMWVFDGAALRTIAFMSALYRGGAKELIEATFENIRNGVQDERRN